MRSPAKCFGSTSTHFRPTALKTVCCDVVNRGVALYGNNVYMETLDNHVIAFDGMTGKIVWNKALMRRASVTQ